MYLADCGLVLSPQQHRGDTNVPQASPISYREQTLLGRPLAIDEVTYFRDVIRRITALLLLGPQTRRQLRHHQSEHIRIVAK